MSGRSASEHVPSAPEAPERAALEALARLFELDPDGPLLLEALTHPSFAHEATGAADNQRLEFLGDAVLNFLVSEELFRLFPDAAEGTLTRTRAQIVSTEALGAYALGLGVRGAIRFGRGARHGRLAESSKVLADALEALLAAAYLERGIDAARRVALLLVEHGLTSSPRAGARDPKSELQERVQARGLRAPTYRVVERRGPAHESEFVVEALVDGQPVARGTGRSRRGAESAAARRALEAEVNGADAAEGEP
jgi:ribonuclease-3